MRQSGLTKPVVFFFLVLPAGISSGFASITLPFILTRAGFSVAMAASIVALGLSANLWRFLWGPIADLTLTARRWYLIGLITTAATLVALALIPLHQNAAALVLVCSPIGTGMNNVWSAVAPDWRASPDMVALVTGVLNGVIAAVGCVAGGWIADRIGIWWAYFGSGIAIALVAVVMAMMPRTPNTFSLGVLAYAFTNGVAYAAFSAIVLVAIGRGAASTKYATLCSFGNLPVVYMTALDGWVHDHFGTGWMLHTDGLTGAVCIVVAMFVLHLINRRTPAASGAAVANPA